MKFERKYDGPDRRANDERAVRDIRDVEGQRNLPGEYMTRAEAEEVLGLLK